MTDVIDLTNNGNFNMYNQQFINDICTGLENTDKYISSKYLYDEQGCEIYNKITKHPDYYLTQCEIEILSKYINKLVYHIGTKSFNLIELGPGEGIKTKILIEAFLNQKVPFRYLPIDISQKFLNNLKYFFNKYIHRLDIIPINSDFFHGLDWISHYSSQANLVLFLGSSIGNYNLNMTYDFLRHLWTKLNPMDYVLIGFDLQKDIPTLMRAYKDYSGITQEFNLNLLKRINRELSANFLLEQFHHQACYNVNLGAMESYLVSNQSQTVYLQSVNKLISFSKNESIHTEYSFKYTLEQISVMARHTGFKLIDNFIDNKNYFTDSLWQVVK